jgi:hypothetical protein
LPSITPESMSLLSARRTKLIGGFGSVNGAPHIISAEACMQ